VRRFLGLIVYDIFRINVLVTCSPCNSLLDRRIQGMQAGAKEEVITAGQEEERMEFSRS
jgi:hypothetical protein